MNASSSGRAARLVKSLVGWLTAGAIGLLALEGLCHVVQLSNDSMPVDYVTDPHLPFRMKPGPAGNSAFGVRYDINAVGLRNPEVVSPKPPGVFRVLALGDSITLGYGLASELSYPRLLEKMAQGARVEVINAGAPGYHFQDFVEYLEHYGMALEPDMVLCALTRSDVDPPMKLEIRDGVGYDDGEKVGIIPPFAKKVLRHSRLYLAAGRTRWELMGYRPPNRSEAARNEAFEKVWPSVEANLNRLTADCEQRQIPLMIAYLPVLPETMRGVEYPALLERFAQREGAKFHFVNVLPKFETEKAKELYLPMDTSHPNALGHQIIARTIADDPFFRRTLPAGVQLGALSPSP